MTDIANVPHILVHGITHRNSANANPNFTPIGDPALISTRDSFLLNNGKTLGEYIPFYFGSRMPMLYVIQKGFNEVPVTPAEDIAYCITSIQKVIDVNIEFVYTDGHAVDSFSSQYGPQDVGDIENQVDFEAVNVRNWISHTDLDLKRRMQAEFLLAGELPYSSVLGFIVKNQAAKTRLKEFGVAENQILIRTNAYF
jgi:hypothetical protein